MQQPVVRRSLLQVSIYPEHQVSVLFFYFEAGTGRSHPGHGWAKERQFLPA
jgi:hypothetical protein